jgi:single-strand DNA-binding protein
MLNHIALMGRLTADPELRRTSNGIAVASFALAVERDRKDKATGEREADFIRCTAWRSTGEFVSKYFSKGQMAIVSGRLLIDQYTDKDGNHRNSAEVQVENIYFGDSKRSDTGRSNYSTGAQDSGSHEMTEADDDEPLPF